jgi:phosphoribosylaminoimidazolecarboxamide formyltransferase/IMP cyclohydrolase
VSVYDKAGLDQLATALKAAGIEVVSTGGTARALEAHGVKVTDVAAVTGFPEILDGRVKTLHPNVFAGLLYRRDRPDDIDIVARHGIGPIDAVIVNLYPFEAIVAQPDCRPADAIELIDIGGPSLVRAAAKNHAFTAVVTGPDQYPDLIATIARGGTTLAERRLLAARAFERTAAYDTAIAAWMARHAGLVAEPQSPAPATNTLDAAPLPARFSLELQERLPLRYGENPHQSAALYAPAGSRVGLAGLKQLCGKELSYNNLLDLDGATRLAALLEPPAAIVVKHTNPCGAATGSTIDGALATAMAADPTSAFGSIVAEVAEVSVAADGRIRVHRVVAAVDCGLPVNPNIIAQQVESGIIDGLSAALYGELAIDGGTPRQSNFHDYRLLRIDECPVIETHIVPSLEAPSGIGEPGLPPIAPAVANALFTLTGTRLRSLPLRMPGGATT